MANIPPPHQTDWYLDNTTGEEGHVGVVTGFTPPRPTINHATPQPSLSGGGGLMRGQQVPVASIGGEGSIAYKYDATNVVQRYIEAAASKGTVHTLTERIYLTPGADEYADNIYRVTFGTVSVQSNPSAAERIVTVPFFEQQAVGPLWGDMPDVFLAASGRETIDLSKLCADATTFAVQATDPTSGAFGSGTVTGTMLTVSGHATDSMRTVITLRATDRNGITADTDIVVMKS